MKPSNAFCIVGMVVVATFAPGAALGEPIGRDKDIVEVALASADVLLRAFVLARNAPDPYSEFRIGSGPAQKLGATCASDALSKESLNRECGVLLLDGLCGADCILWKIDGRVYQENKHLIEETLRTPCDSLRDARPPPGYRDSHPRTFYMSLQRSNWLLGCFAERAVGALDIEYSDNRLKVKYGVVTK